jgi:ClpX C4-type zinc finger
LTVTLVPRRKAMQAAQATGTLHCSFCGKDRQHVTQMIAGPGIHICDACVGLCNRMLTGRTTAPFAIWKSLSDDELLGALPASAAAVEATEEKLHEHVALLRERGVSWERIAATLGVSRQAAWERFSRES